MSIKLYRQINLIRLIGVDKKWKMSEGLVDSVVIKKNQNKKCITIKVDYCWWRD
jgi:hypothetical protein